jgi:hypothetical protein
MAKIHNITLGDFGHMGVDENNKLYWDGQPVVTEEKITLSKWVNFAIILGAGSTFFYALVTVLAYLKISI